MGSIVRFAAVNAKIKSLEGKFLTKEQYNKLLNFRTVNEAVIFLKEETHYSKILSKYDNEEIHRMSLEYILKKNYVKNFEKLSHYFNNNYKKLIDILFMRFQIEDLKVIFRGKYIGKSYSEIRDRLISDGKLNELNYDKIVKSKDIEEVIQNLKGTVYYKHLLPLAKSFKQEGLFRIETTLDFVYFSLLRKRIPKLDKEDREIMQKIIGVESDLLNIQWIYRGKFYYKVNPEQLLIYTIYNGYKLKREQLKQLSYIKTKQEFYDIIKQFPYNTVFDINKSSEYLVERQMMVYLRQMFETFKKTNKMNISSAAAYFELQFLEVRDIISIIENIRYGIKFDEASRYITASI